MKTGDAAARQSPDKTPEPSMQKRGCAIMRHSLAILMALSSCLLLSSCNKRDKTPPPPPPPPSVVCFAAIKTDVATTYEIIGQTVAEESVNIVPMVEGYLIKQGFDEGSMVKKGDLLFEIDPRPYEAQVKNAEGQVTSAKAQLVNANIEYARYTSLAKDSAVAQKSADAATMSKGQAEGQTLVSEAALDTAKINLGYTKLVAPFDGKIGTCPISVGNLVGQAGSRQALTSIMRLDPMKVEFNIPEPAIASSFQKRGNTPGTGKLVVPSIILPNGSPYPHEGSIYFLDNQITSATGTISVRARFPNPDAILIPNEYVKIRLVFKEKIPTILIPQIATTDDMTGKFVMVVKDGKVERRQIKTGQSHDANVEVLSGLAEGEWVVTEGLLKIRPGMAVDPKLDAPVAAPKAAPAKEQ